MTTTAPAIPLRLRIGVTGHRALVDERAIGESIDVAISRLRSLAPSTLTTPVLFEVVSPLGEGADRLVAAHVLQDTGATLEVPLPLPPDDYETDFRSEESRNQFRELAARADSIWVAGGRGRVDAYVRVGAYIVDSCDVLIAIWDGLPSRGWGGTADVLDLAKEQGMPTFVISAAPPYDVRDPPMPSRFDLIGQADRYNRMLRMRPERSSGLAVPPAQAVNGEQRALEPYVSWVKPWYGAADAVANRYRRRFVWASRLLFLLSAFAVLAVAISAESEDFGRSKAFAGVEAVLMCGAVALWLSVRRRLHDSWITSRFLAERLRSAVFLAFAGADSPVEPTPQGSYRSTNQEWLSRLFREIWRLRPRDLGSATGVEVVKTTLESEWIHPQIDYYRERGHRHAAAYRTLMVMSGALLIAAIAAAIVDASRTSETGSPTVVVLSIALPAFAAALIGIAALEQHARYAERFALIAQRLEESAKRLVRADDPQLVADIALRVDAELRTEAAAWIDVMRFHDVELPA